MPPVRNARSTGVEKSFFPFETLEPKVVGRITAFIYGAPGSGKTFLLRSVVDEPRMLPALLLVCDQGQASIIDLVDNKKLFAMPISETPTKSTLTQLEEVVNWLGDNPSKFKTLLVDNVTELHRNFLMAQAKGRVTAASSTKSIYEVTQNDYGVARNQFLVLISAITLKLPALNVVVTALASMKTDDVTGTTYVMPHINGKLADEVPGYFDVVGFLSRKGPTAMERRAAAAAGTVTKDLMMLQVAQTSTVIQARNRGNKLGSEPLINPTLSQIYRAYVQEEEEE